MSFVAAILIIVATVLVTLALLAARLSRPALGPGGVDPLGATASGRNHREMARLLERLIRDDDVRPLLPPDELAVARTLLEEYWGDSPKQLP